MSFFRWVVCLAILTVVPLLLPSSGHAAFRARVAVEAEDDNATLLVNGRLIARLRAENAGLLPPERAEVAAERLRGAIGRGLSPAAVGVRRMGDSVAVTLGPSLLMLATPGDARANQVRALLLARQWARRLRTALALPGLTLTRTRFVVPFEETRAAKIGGVARGDLSVRVDEPRVAQAAVEEAQAALVIRGLSPGSTLLRLRRDGAEVAVRVEVRKYAGAVSGTVATEVTGRPAPPGLVAAVALDRYRDGLWVEAGAAVRLHATPQLTRPLEPGEGATVSLPLTISGRGYLPREAVATVQVRNRPLPQREAGALLYSNEPEQVHRFGVLYQGRVETDAPTRLLYHHQNRMGRAFYLALDLINTGEKPARLQVVEGAAKPIVDTVLVGHRAGARYVRNVLRDIGTIVEVPAGTRRTILTQRVAPVRTASGIYGLRPVSGPALFVQVAALTEPVTVRERAAGLGSTALSEHVYPSPRKRLRARYRVGSHWAFVSVGKRAIDGRHAKRRLDGNYGVFYDITLDIENPGTEATTVNLVLVPDAGSARGVFLVEGRLVELPSISPPAEFVLGALDLQPSSRSRVTLRTLPVGGSSYPVTLVVRARRPGEPRHQLLSLRGETKPMTEQVTDETPGN